MSETMPNDVPMEPPDGATVEVGRHTWALTRYPYNGGRQWRRVGVPQFASLLPTLPDDPYTFTETCVDGQVLTALWRERELRKRDAEDAARLDWWEKNLNVEHAWVFEEECDEPVVRLFRKLGNRNDRTWDPLADGPTLRAAIDQARRA